MQPGSPWGDRATALLIDKTPYRKIVEIAKAEGVTTNIATLTRHNRHIVLTTIDPAPVAPVKANNIEILETIIQKGFQNQKNWKPTISDTMKAMDMWFRLTQGNPFDELLETLAAASMEPELVASSDEAPEATGGVDERGLDLEEDG